MRMHIPGSFDMPDQVRYIVYKVMTAACNRPELGWPNDMKQSQHLLHVNKTLFVLTSNSNPRLKSEVDMPICMLKSGDLCG